MNKVCATCGRENPADAFQCFACRSRDFGANSPCADYRVSQQALARERHDKQLQEAIESCKQFPGRLHRRLLAGIAVVSVFIGAIAGPGTVAKFFIPVGCMSFGWLMLTFRIDSMREGLERRRRKDRGDRPG